MLAAGHALRGRRHRLVLEDATGLHTPTHLTPLPASLPREACGLGEGELGGGGDGGGELVGEGGAGGVPGGDAPPRTREPSSGARSGDPCQLCRGVGGVEAVQRLIPEGEKE